ncbi:hypothetical protein ACWCPM_11745 [Streptomyces sp. NPDC002309]
MKSTILHGRVLRSRTVPGLEQEIYALEVARVGAALFATVGMDTVLFGAVTPDRARELVPEQVAHG